MDKIRSNTYFGGFFGGKFELLPHLQNESDDDISHLEWETVRVRFIKAGTLEKLVESLGRIV